MLTSTTWVHQVLCIWDRYVYTIKLCQKMYSDANKYYSNQNPTLKHPKVTSLFGFSF